MLKRGLQVKYFALAFVVFGTVGCGESGEGRPSCEGDGDCEPDEICIDWPPEEAAECIWVGCDRDDQCRPGEVCVIDDICRAPADVGPCDAVFPRWFYNSDTGECEAMCPSFASKLTIAPRAGHCEAEPVAAD
jgi:hypothetical protein